MGNRNCLISKADSDLGDDDDGFPDVEDTEEAQCLSQLHVAAERGDAEAVRSLLVSSTDVDVLDTLNNTPLHYASKNGHVEVVNLLISKNADVNACNNTKMTPLHLACQNGHSRVVGILLDNQAIVDVTKQSKETPFYLAALNGHADVVDLLIRRGLCDFVLTKEGKTFFSAHDETPLHVAVKGGHTEVVKVILDHSRRIYEELTRDGDKLKESAKELIETDDIKAIQLLESDGRRISLGTILTENHIALEILRNSHGYTALQLAVRSLNLRMVQLLLNPEQCPYSEKHLREIFDYWSDITILFQYEEIVQALISSSKFNVNRHNSCGLTILHDLIQNICSLFDKRAKNIHLNYVIQLLLEKGADFNMKTFSGETPLIIAAKRGCCGAIKILFDWEEKSGMKLDIDARDECGETALMKAAERHHVSVVQMLLRHKASVNLCDNGGFTALHAVIHGPNTISFDFHFFYKRLLKRKFDCFDSLKMCISRGKSDSCATIDRLQKYLERSHEVTRLKEEVVKLLLDSDDTNVNATDFRGYTPLDLDVMSSMGISSPTYEALKSHGAIRTLQESSDESPIEVAKIDERGRNPIHRLIINPDSYISELQLTEKETNIINAGILLSSENFKHLAIATDNKGRTPLHYAAISPFMLLSYMYFKSLYYMYVEGLMELGADVNATDIYGKIPLHYATRHDVYERLVQCGADENTKDKHGHTPKDLKMLRESVEDNEEKAKTIVLRDLELHVSEDIVQSLNANHVTALTKHKQIKTIRIQTQSLIPEGSSEEAIWRIWTQCKLFRLNRRLRKLRPSVHQFIERLADCIKEKDERFECQPILVGSADEESKADISADFDFNFKLVKISQLCEAFPHPWGPKGYFELRRKPSEDGKRWSDEEFFNSEQCLLTNDVNSRFKYILVEVLSDPTFWHGEHRFDWDEPNLHKARWRSSGGMCKTLLLKLINPIADEEGGLLFVDISIDIVACVQVTDWSPEDPLPLGISPATNTKDSTFVFDEPRLNFSSPRIVHSIMSETFTRISFAPLESRIIKESPPLMKAAFMMCKLILHSQWKTTYQLKNCLLFCMEALNAQNVSEARNDDEITPKKLAFWVERIMFCFTEFCRHHVFPCYFMPSFRQQVFSNERGNRPILHQFEHLPSMYYCRAYAVYIQYCIDDTTFDTPLDLLQMYDHLGEFNPRFETKDSPTWEQFDREEFIKTLFRVIPDD